MDENAEQNLVSQSANSDSAENIIQAAHDVNYTDSSVTYEIGEQNIFDESAPKFYQLGEGDFDDQNLDLPDVLVPSLTKNHIVLVQCPPLMNTIAVGRSVARALNRALGIKTITQLVSNVYQWNDSYLVDDVTGDLGENGSKQIYVFENVQTEHLGANLTNLAQRAQACDCFVIVMTHDPLDSWNLTSYEKALCIELEAKKLYNSDFMGKCFRAKLEIFDIDSKWREFLQANDKKILTYVNTPEALDRLLMSIKLETEEPSTERVQRLAEQAQDVFDSILQNYRKPGFALAADAVSRNRLVWMLVSLLSGMEPAATFAAFDEIVERGWRQRLPQMQSFDFEDMGVIRQYYNIPEEVSNGGVIAPIYAGTRERLLRLSVQQHGRFLTSALQVMCELVEESVTRDSLRISELFVLYERRWQFRRAVSKGLGLVLACAPAVAMPALWRLTCHHHNGVQSTASRAIASLLGQNRPTLFNRIIFSMQNEKPKVLQLARSFHASQFGKNIARNIDYSLSMALGDSARFYPPNQFPDAQIKQLEQLIRVAPPSAVANAAPPVIKHHFQQLEASGTLEQWAGERGFYEAVALGLKSAMTHQADEVSHFVKQLAEKAFSLPRSDSASVNGPRQYTLACVAEFFEQCDESLRDEYFSHDRLSVIITGIINEETSPVPRSSALKAASKHIRSSFSWFESVLVESVGSLNDDEKGELEVALLQEFITQRTSVNATDGEIVIDRLFIPYSLNQAKNVTPIEKSMFGWISAQGDTPIGEFGLRLHHYIARNMKLYINRKISEDQIYQRNLEPVSEIIAVVEDSPVVRKPPVPGFNGLFAAIATFFNRDQRNAVINLIPTILELNRVDQKSVQMTLSDLANSDYCRDEGLAKSLNLALRLHAFRSRIFK